MSEEQARLNGHVSFLTAIPHEGELRGDKFLVWFIWRGASKAWDVYAYSKRKPHGPPVQVLQSDTIDAGFKSMLAALRNMRDDGRLEDFIASGVADHHEP